MTSSCLRQLYMVFSLRNVTKSADKNSANKLTKIQPRLIYKSFLKVEVAVQRMFKKIKVHLHDIGGAS